MEKPVRKLVQVQGIGDSDVVLTSVGIMKLSGQVSRRIQKLKPTGFGNGLNVLEIGAIKEDFEVSGKSNWLNKVSFTEEEAGHKGIE